MKLFPPIFTVICLAMITACKQQVPNGEEPAIHGLLVTWTLLSNDVKTGKYRASFTIRNNDNQPLQDPWTIYFNQMTGTMVENSIDPGITLGHVAGDYWKISPTSEFKPIKPGEEKTYQYEMNDNIVSVSKTPRNVYYVIGDSQPKLAEYQMAPFKPEHFQSFNPPTSESRFKQNEQQGLLPSDQLSPVIPTPANYVLGKGQTTFSGAIQISFSPGLESEANYLAESLRSLFSGAIDLKPGTSDGPSIIKLALDPKQKSAESYELLSKTSMGVAISGSDRAGIFYGIQSLRGLISAENYKTASDQIVIPEIIIQDNPRFSYRGLMLDAARNFQTKETVKKLLDLMSFYKLNKFHFHLTDDEGWRFEIPELPELTEVGSRRGHTTDEKTQLYPLFGSGPDPDNSSGSGFYTDADFIEILRYANRRHIEVIPEIDVPGHARAAIKSMKIRSERLLAQGKAEEASQFLLHDPEDQSVYNSAQNYRDNVLCICQESTYHFLEVVVNRVVKLFEMAEVPLRALHTGGDEVPGGAWEKSPVCQDFFDSNSEVNEVADLHDYFLQRFHQILAKHQLVTAGWEEIAIMKRFHEDHSGLQPNPRFMKNGFQPYVWNTTLGGGAEDLAYKLANAGFQTVMCNVSNLYLDLAYNRDPWERGLNWGGYVDTRKTFEVTPFDIFQTATTDKWGNPLDETQFREGKIKLTERGKNFIMGLQGELWSELLNNSETMEYMAFPKVLGLAERAWSPQPEWAEIADPDLRFEILNRSWNRFANNLGQRELPRLSFLNGGVNYRVPLPGAIIEDGQLKANVSFPGLSIYYTTDGTEPTAESIQYIEPVAVTGSIRLKAFTTSGKASRTVVVVSE